MKEWWNGQNKTPKSTQSSSGLTCSSKTPGTNTPHHICLKQVQPSIWLIKGTLPFTNTPFSTHTTPTRHQQNHPPQPNRDYSVKESTLQPLPKLSMLSMSRIRHTGTLASTMLPSSSLMLRNTSGNDSQWSNVESEKGQRAQSKSCKGASKDDELFCLLHALHELMHNQTQ